MKCISAVLVIFCLLSCSGDKKNSLTDKNLKGDVRILSEFGYRAVFKFGEIQKGSLAYRLLSDFDENGNIVSENWLDSDTRNIYKYDSIGKLIEQDKHNELKTPSLSSKKKFTYDQNNNLIEKNTYLPDGFLFEKIIYDYDEKGNNIESKCYNYDFEGKELLQFMFKHSYDKKGNEIDRDHYDNLGNKEYTETYKYDEKGLMIEEFTDFLKDKIHPKKIRYAYDNKGNILSIKHYSSEEVIVYEKTHKYKFDKIGNWIEKIHFINGKPDFIEQREISYGN
jgi:hypothetical protein